MISPGFVPDKGNRDATECQRDKYRQRRCFQSGDYSGTLGESCERFGHFVDPFGPLDLLGRILFGFVLELSLV